MSMLRRLVLVRHGETEGNSSVRFHGRNDVALSATGRVQMAAARRRFRAGGFDAVVASPLHRSWEAARIVSGGAPVLLEADFREVDFGRWEGLTREQIRARDPILYEDWQSGSETFRYPEGESRKDFEARVENGFQRLMQGSLGSALVAVHRGVIRVISGRLLEEPLTSEDPALELGGVLELVLGSRGRWQRGLRSSDPAPAS